MCITEDVDGWNQFSTISGPSYIAPTTAKSSGFSLSSSHEYLSFSSSGTVTPSTQVFKNFHSKHDFNEQGKNHGEIGCQEAEWYLRALWRGSQSNTYSAVLQDQSMEGLEHPTLHMLSQLWSNACCLHLLDKVWRCCKEQSSQSQP